MRCLRARAARFRDNDSGGSASLREQDLRRLEITGAWDDAGPVIRSDKPRVFSSRASRSDWRLPPRDYRDDSIDNAEQPSKPEP